MMHKAKLWLVVSLPWWMFKKSHWLEEKGDMEWYLCFSISIWHDMIITKSSIDEKWSLMRISRLILPRQSFTIANMNIILNWCLLDIVASLFELNDDGDFFHPCSHSSRYVFGQISEPALNGTIVTGSPHWWLERKSSPYPGWIDDICSVYKSFSMKGVPHLEKFRILF